MRRALLTLLLLGAMQAPAWAHERALPVAWHLYCNQGDDYQAGITDTDSHGGKWCGYIRAPLGKPNGFASVDQGFRAEKFRGKRLRYRVWLKAVGVKGHADMWMRVDGKQDRILAFDGMQGRRLKGTLPWKAYDIVLDVPKEAEKVAFGLVLDGEGVLCFDDVKFDVVSEAVATTDLTPKQDFEK